MKRYTDEELSRIIEMAWEDRTPLEALEKQFQLKPNALVKLMRLCLNEGSFIAWRKRMRGRVTKHLKLRSEDVERAYCKTQYKHRKVSK